MSLIDLLWIVPVGSALLVLAAGMLVTVPLSVALLGVLGGQVAGLLRRVPFTYNLRNLVVRWKTNVLTIVAFVCVVALLTFMLAFVNGMYYLTGNTGNPANVFVLADGATDELFSNLGYGDVKEMALQPGVLKDDDGQPLASWELYCVVNQPILVRKCPKCGQMVAVDRFGRELIDHDRPAAGPGLTLPRWPLLSDALPAGTPGYVALVLSAAILVLAVGFFVAGLAGHGLMSPWQRSLLVLAGAALVAWLIYLEAYVPGHAAGDCPGSGTNIVGSRGRRLLQVRGVEDPAKTGKVHGLPLKAGGWFSQSGVQPLPGSSSGEQAIQAVIGEGLSRELGPDAGKKALEIGDVFDLGPRKWVVTGILNSSGSTFDSEVWAKFQLVGQQFGKPTYTTCVLRTAGPDEAVRLADYLKREYKKPAVSAQQETVYYAGLNTTNQQFLYATIVVMLIMAIGCAFGVMNTMFAAIAQRTKDIGVLRIIGYSRWQVLTSFFMEALALAVLGGLIGIGIGSLCHGLSATSNIASGPGGGKSVVIKLVVDQYVLITGMGFSLFMGCVGGLIPALSAMRLKPLESLR